MTLDVTGHYGRPDVFSFAVTSGRRGITGSAADDGRYPQPSDASP
jgi:hypothetical protein